MKGIIIGDYCRIPYPAGNPIYVLALQYSKQIATDIASFKEYHKQFTYPLRENERRYFSPSQKEELVSKIISILNDQILKNAKVVQDAISATTFTLSLYKV